MNLKIVDETTSENETVPVSMSFNLSATVQDAFRRIQRNVKIDSQFAMFLSRGDHEFLKLKESMTLADYNFKNAVSSSN